MWDTIEMLVVNSVMGDKWLWMPEWEYIPWCDTVWYAGKFWIYFNINASFEKLKDLDSRLEGVTGRPSVNQNGSFQNPNNRPPMLNIICLSAYNVCYTIFHTYIIINNELFSYLYKNPKVSLNHGFYWSWFKPWFKPLGLNHLV